MSTDNVADDCHNMHQLHPVCLRTGTVPRTYISWVLYYRFPIRHFLTNALYDGRGWRNGF